MVTTNSVLTQYDSSTVLKKAILEFAEGTSEKGRKSSILIRSRCVTVKSTLTRTGGSNVKPL